MYIRSYYLQQLSLRQLKTPNLKEIEMEYLVATLLYQSGYQCSSYNRE